MHELPSIFVFETVLGCNLRCTECAVGSKRVKRKYGHMTLEQYYLLAGKIKPYVQYLYLHLWGEPMLNRNIYSMIRHASRFTKTNISTNANFLDVNKAHDLISSGVTDIIVSIDGVTQPVYEKHRRQGDVSAALKGLVYLANFNEKLGKPARIIPQYIVFEHNVHEMQAFKAICNELGLNASFKAPYLRADSVLKASGIPEYTRQIKEEPELRKREMKKCPSARETMTILLDGQVVACCYDHNGVTNFGNLYTQGVEEVWNSPAAQTFREQIWGGSPDPFCMENCLMY